jgi:uracil-DNA glycosylase family 4
MPRLHPDAKCEECPLYGNGSFVPSEGPASAEVAFIGEAPGMSEAQYGRPFIGPSGQLLMKIAGAHGYKRDEVLLTNATLCRPKDNQTPPPAAVAACKPRLLGELAERGVRHSVALGNTAAQVLLETSVGITQLRIGPGRPSPSNDQMEVIPTWHPAYVLRNADAFQALVRDIGKLKGVQRAWDPPVWRAYEDPDEALQVIDAVHRRTKRLAVDIEVGIEKDVGFGHPAEYGLLSVGLCYERGKVVVLGESALRDRRVLDRLGELLRDPEVRCTYHNGKFDTAGLYQHVGDLLVDFDTMLAHYNLDETAGGHDLGSIGIEELGTPDWKGVIKRYTKGGSYALVPRPILYKYQAYDCAVTWDVEDLLTPKLEMGKEDWPYKDLAPKSLRDVHDFMVKAGDQLKFLEMNGVTIDRAYSDQLSETYIERVNAVEERLNAIVAESNKVEYDFLNPRSPLQLKKFFTAHGYNLESTNADTLTRLQTRLRAQSTAPNVIALHSGEPSLMERFIEILLEHRRKQKLYSTYVKGIRKRMYRGRVYTTYLLHGTTSGRLASRDPNLQNIVRDREIRQQFTVAKPEHVLVQYDYKQAEGRIITWLAQDEYLRGILSDNTRDLFDELGKDLNGVRFDPKDKDQRVRTKAYFYGMGYGREAYSIAMEYNLPVREAERGLAAFKELIPATVAWQKTVRDAVLTGKDLVSPFGRRRRYYLITEQNRKDILNEALSFLPQSTASDICLSALIRLRPMLRGLGWIRLTIHDALVVECPTENVDRVSDLVRRVMIEEADKIVQGYVPFDVDRSIGKHWGEL